MTKLLKNAFFIMLLGMANCSTTYVPSPGTIKQKNIPENFNRQTLTLVNAQASSESVNIGDNCPFSLKGNLHQLTNEVIDILKEELGKAGVVFTEDSSKVLKLAVTNTSFESAAGGFGSCTQQV